MSSTYSLSIAGLSSKELATEVVRRFNADPDKLCDNIFDVLQGFCLAVAEEHIKDPDDADLYSTVLYDMIKLDVKAELK